MNKIFKKILIKLADSILILTISIIAIGSAGFVYAAISNFSYNPNVKSLTKDQYNSLVSKVNELITRKDAISVNEKTKLTMDRSSCSWQNITTDSSQECPNGYFVSGLCLSNSITGCPNGTAGTNTGNAYTSGAIRCCKAGS